MINKSPKISVIMSVFNGEKFLTESIESILNQKEKDFEFIIVNDGSTDGSKNIIEHYKDKDNRVILIDQDNRGLINSLNTAVNISRGKYIARMDADDISLFDRLFKTIEFMEKEKAYLCGSWVELINEKSEKIGIYNYPKRSWSQNKLYLLRSNPLIHPTIIFKKEILDNKFIFNQNKLYRNYKKIEDYELWTRIIPIYKTINIQEPLLRYRIHRNQITKKYNWKMRFYGIWIRILALWRLITR